MYHTAEGNLYHGMATNRLKDIALRQSRCPKGKSVLKLHDGEGLYLWVFPNGRKYWRLRYEWDGKEKLVALGVYDRVSLTEARRQRDALQSQRAAGLDPSDSRKAERLARAEAATNTFEAVAREWYGKQRHTWSQSHTRDIHASRFTPFPAICVSPTACHRSIFRLRVGACQP
jgi:hypothetical protein